MIDSFANNSLLSYQINEFYKKYHDKICLKRKSVSFTFKIVTAPKYIHNLSNENLNKTK